MSAIHLDAEQMLKTLATACSATDRGVTRHPFSAEHRQANLYLQRWMQAAGLECWLDDAGTLIGRHAGSESEKTLLIGSHQDSVREGGAYDGIMGVVLGIAALGRLDHAGVQLPFSVEILSFADEEGVRFPGALMGPRCLAGTFDPRDLEGEDKDGIALSEAMRRFGLRPENLSALARDPAQCLGYLEWHIEQGPILEAEDLALGVVTGICGIERHQVRFVGRAAHAGTTPMHLRHDALAAAAQLVLAAEAYALEHPEVRACVGQLKVSPGVANAIPGQVDLILELRSTDDQARALAAEVLLQQASAQAEARGVGLNAHRSYRQMAVPTDPGLSAHLSEVLTQVTGREAFALPSGATHDASAMADLCPIAMLFVRCKAGISHNPAEWASPEDMSLSIEVLEAFLHSLAQQWRQTEPLD